MADCEVKCITKPNPLSAHEHITHIGNPYANGLNVGAVVLATAVISLGIGLVRTARYAAHWRCASGMYKRLVARAANASGELPPKS
jgi:hypothetical protein